MKSIEEWIFVSYFNLFCFEKIEFGDLVEGGEDVTSVDGGRSGWFGDFVVRCRVGRDGRDGNKLDRVFSSIMTKCEVMEMVKITREALDVGLDNMRYECEYDILGS